VSLRGCDTHPPTILVEAIDHPFTSDQRLRKAERLLKRTDFKACERFGARKGGRSLVIYAAPNGLEWSRLGLTVSRKAGNAVRRNQWKRRLRDAFRRNKTELPVGYDFVVIVRSSTSKREHPDMNTLSEEFIASAHAAATRANSPG
jgi:ribonuclease P protein component